MTFLNKFLNDFLNKAETKFHLNLAYHIFISDARFDMPSLFLNAQLSCNINMATSANLKNTRTPNSKQGLPQTKISPKKLYVSQ